MTRQIVLDTETTGIGHELGHRIIEIGCVEMIDRRLTGQHFHYYINPERDIDEGAFRVHGISRAFLQDKPIFRDIFSLLLDFIDDAELIIHNAPFDVGFLNAEIRRIDAKDALEKHCTIFDTLVYARQKHPGQRNGLDALCKRYDVDNSNRQLHGALLDAEILARVYLAMTGGQVSLFSDEPSHDTVEQVPIKSNSVTLNTQSPVIKASDNERELHEQYIKFLIEKSGVNHWE